MSAIFNLFALIYVFRGIQIAIKVGREWSSLRQEPLTPAKKQLAELASFFLAVPPAVVVHEFFHALATWLFGGRIVDFGYGVFWGYVVPVGDFSAAQDWFIALAGTLGSLTFGVAVWLALRHNRSSAFRYFGLRAFRFQIYFALLYYPILSVFIPSGSDWRVIYDFGSTMVLSGLTAVVHIPALYLFWKTDREGRFEHPAFRTVQEQAEFNEIEATAVRSPNDPQIQLQYIDALRRGGVTNKSTQELKQFLQNHPDSGIAHLEWALLQNDKNKTINKKVFTHAQQALTLGLNPEAALLARQLVAKYYVRIDKAKEAVAEIDQALALTGQTAVSPSQLGHLFLLRARAFRRQSQFEQARQDIDKATKLAQQANDAYLLTECKNETAVLANHAKRPLASETIS